MSDGTDIEWTDATWQPITGCSIVSPGCTNCYAMKLAGTRLRNIPSRKGLTSASKAGPVWNGKVRLNEEWLTQPLRWKKPRKIFVCAHGDLFHESAPDEWIDKVFAVMALCPQHQFQVLTKRAERMRAYCARLSERSLEIAQRAVWLGVWDDPEVAATDTITALDPGLLPNVWLGVSAERQQEADERIPHLLQTPAAIRFVSCEPLLGAIDLTRIANDGSVSIDALRGGKGGSVGGLDWVIVGGESGPGARPMMIQWVRSLHDQCEAASVKFFFKQWGAHAPDDPTANRTAMRRVGKKAAGRLLDGKEHNGMPGCC